MDRRHFLALLPTSIALASIQTLGQKEEYVLTCTSVCSLNKPCGFHQLYGFTPINRERYNDIRAWSTTINVVY